ncbi:MAG: response regulator [Piscinibacter sp.]|nr:response regulator [Piscinibacter sp.]
MQWPTHAWRRMEHVPLRRRLTWLAALGAGLTALVALLALAGTGWWIQEERARADTEEVLLTMAYALQAPLAFDDAAGIAEAMALLKARPTISGAWVRDGRGRLVAQHGRGAAPDARSLGGGLASGSLSAQRAIVVDGVQVGSLVVANDLSGLWTPVFLATGSVALASLVGFAVAMWLARHIAAAFTQPVAELARVSREMAADPSAARPLRVGAGGEVGAAVDAFNRMLGQIGERDAALLRANRDLEQRVAERTDALRLEKERAESALIAKTRFLANMSHELRTPLNAVIGAAQLLQSRDAPATAGADADAVPGQAHLVEVIRQSGLNLLGLIENVLDLSRIETGALDLQPEDFNLLDCIEAAVSTAAVPARIKGLQLACTVDPALPLWRHGDAQRLRQVLLNLLGNAVKFTPQGTVALSVGPGAEPHALRLVVRDTGIGIGEESIGHVFEPFRQADDAASRRFGGSGLGLAISRQLVQAMGGRIEVRSRPGEGSTFTAELALPPAQEPGAEPPALAQHVLYLEPHEESAAALAAQLERLGCCARRCRDADEVERLLATPGSPSRPTWLLVATDAPDATRCLERAAGRIEPGRIVLMSGEESLAGEAMRQRLQVPRGLVKPVLRSALVSRFGALSRPEGVAPAAREEGAAGPAARHILVVEDDRVNQTIVCAMLRQAGYRTTTADDGAQALALLACDDYDLVLMDWQMPDMDGLEVTRRLRAGEAGRHGTTVPIVALTANAFVEDRTACLAAGMNDFLTKPVLAARLEAAVARWTPTARASNARTAFGVLHTMT